MNVKVGILVLHKEIIVKNIKNFHLNRLSIKRRKHRQQLFYD